jgi:hypothetical protein
MPFNMIRRGYATTSVAIAVPSKRGSMWTTSTSSLISTSSLRLDGVLWSSRTSSSEELYYQRDIALFIGRSIPVALRRQPTGHAGSSGCGCNAIGASLWGVRELGMKAGISANTVSRFKTGVALWWKHLFRYKLPSKRSASFSFLPTSMEARAFGSAKFPQVRTNEDGSRCSATVVEFVPEEGGRAAGVRLKSGKARTKKL